MFTNWNVAEHDLSETSSSRENHTDAGCFDDYLPTDIPENATELETQIKELVINLYSNEGKLQNQGVDDRRHVFGSITSHHRDATYDVFDLHTLSGNDHSDGLPKDLSAEPRDFLGDFYPRCSTPSLKYVLLGEYPQRDLHAVTTCSVHGNTKVLQNADESSCSGVVALLNTTPTPKLSCDKNDLASFDIERKYIVPEYESEVLDPTEHGKHLSSLDEGSEAKGEAISDLSAHVSKDNCSQNGMKNGSADTAYMREAKCLENSSTKGYTDGDNGYDLVYKIGEFSKTRPQKNNTDDQTQPAHWANEKRVFHFQNDCNNTESIHEFAHAILPWTKSSAGISYDSGLDSWMEPVKENEGIVEKEKNLGENDVNGYVFEQGARQNKDHFGTKPNFSQETSPYIQKYEGETDNNFSITTDALMVSEEEHVCKIGSAENNLFSTFGDYVASTEKQRLDDEMNVAEKEFGKRDTTFVGNRKDGILAAAATENSGRTEHLIQQRRLHKLHHQLVFLGEKSTRLEEQLHLTEDDVSEAHLKLEKAQVDLGSAINNSETSESNRKIVKRQIHELADAKEKIIDDTEWYKFQIRSLQESRLKLEMTIEESKAKGNEDVKIIHQLSVEKERLRNELVELKQRNIDEKQSILSQLEKVEADLITESRSKDRYNTELAALQSSIINSEEKVSALQDKVIEVCALLARAEEEESKLCVSVAEKEAFIKQLLTEKDDMSQQINENKQLLEISNSENEKLQASLDKALEDLNRLIEVNEGNVSEKAILTDEINQLKAEVAKGFEERSKFDQATLALKHDMEKMSVVFNIVRRQLLSKSRQLKDIDNKKKAMLEELTALQDTMLSREKVEQELKEVITLKTRTIEKLLVCKREAEMAMKEQKKLTRKYETDLELAKKENIDLSKEKSDMERSFEETKVCLKDSLKQTKTCRDKVQLVESEKAAAITSLESKLCDSFNEISQLKKSHCFDVANLEKDLNTLQKAIDQKQDIVESQRLEYDRELKLMKEIIEEEKDIKNKAIIYLKEEKKDLLTSHSKWKKLISEELKQVRKTIKSLKDENSRVIEDYRNFKTFYCDLTKKLQNSSLVLIGNMKRLEEGNKVLKADLTTCQNVLQEQKVENKENLDTINSLQKTIHKLQGDLVQRADESETIKRKTLKLQKRKEELEKHCKDLKEQYETLSNEFQIERKKLMHESTKLTEAKNDLYKELQETHNAFLVTKEELSARGDTLSKVTQELTTRSSIFEETCKINEQLTLTVHELKSTNSYLQTEYNRILRENEAMIDEKRHLHWQHKQLEDEIKRLQSITNHERSCHLEKTEHLDNLFSQSKVEIQNLRKELEQARTDKFEIHGQLLHLREEMRTTNKELAALKQHIKNRNELILKFKCDLADSESRGVKELVDIVTQRFFIDVDFNEGDEKFNSDAIHPSKPIETVRNCIKTLRVELEGLRTQMSFQTQSFEDAKNKWRIFDDNVDRLRNVCSNALPSHESSF